MDEHLALSLVDLSIDVPNSFVFLCKAAGRGNPKGKNFVPSVFCFLFLLPVEQETSCSASSRCPLFLPLLPCFTQTWGLLYSSEMNFCLCFKLLFFSPFCPPSFFSLLVNLNTNIRIPRILSKSFLPLPTNFASI